MQDAASRGAGALDDGRVPVLAADDGKLASLIDYSKLELRVVAYLAGGLPYFYPGVGDPKPPKGAHVHLLTMGGVVVRGTWTDDGRYLGWAPFPKRDAAKEALL